MRPEARYSVSPIFQDQCASAKTAAPVRAAEVLRGYLRQARRFSRIGTETARAALALVAPSVLIDLMVVVVIVVVVIRAETAGFRVDRCSLGLSVLGCDDAKIWSVNY